jgi:hypothetical protein
MPALLTSTRIGPSRSVTSASILSVASGSETSAATANAVPPVSSIEPLIPSAPSRSRE